MQVNLLKPFSRVRKSILSFFPYLYTGSLISPLQCFPFLFSQCHATIHPQSASVLNNKSPFGSFCLQDNQLSVSYSGSQPPCHIVLTCSLFCLRLPLVIYGMQNCRSREKQPGAILCPQPSCPITAKRLWEGLVRDRKPSVTSAMPPPQYSIVLPD